jgi:hypothetical protein
MKTKKELLLEAQKEQCGVVAQHRIQVLRSLDELEEFGGVDDYKVSLEQIVVAYPDKGITLTHVRNVLPDAIALKQAVEDLDKAGVIQVEEVGRTSILRPKAVDLKTMKPAKAVEVAAEAPAA